jgi:uncharacterized protein CbrC (UPF0167 family)
VTEPSSPLPEFPYHPDPLATGAVAPSPDDTPCACCTRVRGYVYTGPVYAAADLTGRLCPWCIADGGAADRFDAHFTSGTALGDDVPQEIFTAVDRRTPGFQAWQEPAWFFHCGDGAAFLGAAGAADLAPYPAALQVLCRETASWGLPPDQAERHLAALDRDGSPTAYLFRCRVCAAYLAYSDAA